MRETICPDVPNARMCIIYMFYIRSILPCFHQIWIQPNRFESLSCAPTMRL